MLNFLNVLCICQLSQQDWVRDRAATDALIQDVLLHKWPKITFLLLLGMNGPQIHANSDLYSTNPTERTDDLPVIVVTGGFSAH